MYVRRWPRISASSRTPPSEIRTSFRPSARAMDFASEVFPTPGGPTKQRICPFISRTRFSTAICSRIRSFGFSSPKWSSSRICRTCSMSQVVLRPLVPRHGDHPVEVAPDHRRLRRERGRLPQLRRTPPSPSPPTGLRHLGALDRPPAASPARARPPRRPARPAGSGSVPG